MGVLYYLSQAVHVPSEHEAAGFVTTTVYENGRPFDWAEMLGDLLTVYVGTSPPHQAAVRVRHRGYWFYIREDDETSKSTFALLGLLFDLQAGDIESTKPVLTLPVGR
jgi:hypothetical protein